MNTLNEPGALAGRRIIDRDVDFYATEIEYCKMQLQRCTPSMEAKWAHRAVMAEYVHRALLRYQQDLGKG